MFGLLPSLILTALISLPPMNVFRGKKSVSVAKRRMIIYVYFFFAIVLETVFFSVTEAYTTGADDVTMKMAGSTDQGLDFIAAALATGSPAFNASIVVAAVVPAAIGTFSENEKNFGKSMIFVALGESVAIYGLLISVFIILMKL